MQKTRIDEMKSRLCICGVESNFAHFYRFLKKALIFDLYNFCLARMMKNVF